MITPGFLAVIIDQVNGWALPCHVSLVLIFAFYCAVDPGDDHLLGRVEHRTVRLWLVHCSANEISIRSRVVFRKERIADSDELTDMLHAKDGWVSRLSRIVRVVVRVVRVGKSCIKMRSLWGFFM